MGIAATFYLSTPAKNCYQGKALEIFANRKREIR
jgi:hypothetical protein